MLRLFLALLLAVAPTVASARSQLSHVMPWLSAVGATPQDTIPSVLPPPDAGPTFDEVYDVPTFDATVGTLRYMSPAGTDSGTCSSILSPCRTLSYTQGQSSTGDAVLCRDGIYRTTGTGQGFSKGITWRAYTGETCEFRGSVDVTTSFNAGTVDGAYRYIAYTELPTTDGAIPLSLGTNVTNSTNGVGMFADQIWIGDCTSGPYQMMSDGIRTRCGLLQEVPLKTDLALGKFWIDRPQNRAYLMNADSQQSAIEISSATDFGAVSANNVKFWGVKITRYSPYGARFSALDVNVVDGFTCRNTEFSDISQQGVLLNGTSADRTEDDIIYYCSFKRTGWMPINGTYNYDTTITGMDFSDNDLFDEFTGSPGSGAKFTHSRNMIIQASEIRNNKMHAYWCDQSCKNVTVASNQITGNSGTCVFFELSEGLLAINNYAQTTGSGNCFKMGGGSNELRIINNTIVGGATALAVLTDKRSVAMCADVSLSPNPSANWTTCVGLGTQSSDRIPTALWDSTIDWQPRISEIYNNIIAWPSSPDSSCGGRTVAFCVTDNNSGTTLTAQSIIHVAEPGRSIPETYMDYNIYQSSDVLVGLPNTSTTATVLHTSVATVVTALAAAPYSLVGMEAHSLATAGLVNSDGSPTQNLIDIEGSAKPIPTDATLNTYIPPDIQCFGVAYQCGP